MSTPGRSNDLPQFTRGRVDPYGGRLLPVCCPDAPTPTFGTTIRIARLHHASCVSRKVDDVRFVLTLGGRC